MSDAKPYRVSMSGTGRVPWAIEGMKDRIFCFASKDEAEHACEIANIVAAARDGEVGRLRTALESIKMQAQQIRELPAWPLVEMNNRLDLIKTVARSALAPGNGGEGEK